MLKIVLAPSQGFEILGNVIQRIAVAMMNKFTFRELTVNRFPDKNCTQFPGLRFSDLNECARLSVLIIPNPNRSDRQVIDRDLTFLKLALWRKVNALLALAPRDMSFRESRSSAPNSGTIRNAQTSLRAELGAIDLMGLEVERRSAYQTRLYHEYSVAYLLLHCAQCSQAYCAVKLKRRGLGCELSPSYFHDALFYLRQAEHESSIPTLFDLLNTEEVSI